MRTQLQRRWRYLAVYAASLGVCVAAGIAVRIVTAPKAVTPGSYATLPDRAEYFLGDFREGIDGFVYLHGWEGVVEPMKAADVLFVGNSRMKYAFRRESLAPFFHRAGLKYYNLAFGHDEQMLLPRALIRKHDLRPRWLVVNVAPFFLSRVTVYSHSILTSTRFDGWKARFERTLTFHAERWLSALMPFPFDDGIEFRSWRDGTILSPERPGHPSATKTCNGNKPEFEATILAEARAFLDEMGKRGTQVILTTVPPGSDCLVRRVAEVLKLPLVLPDTGPVLTFDDSHLTAEGALRFAPPFLAALEPHLRPAARSLSSSR